MIRKEPPISRTPPIKESSSEISQETPLRTFANEPEKRQSDLMENRIEKSRQEPSSAGKPHYPPYEAPPVSLWLPFTAYFIYFILAFLKKIDYNLIYFSESLLSPTAPLGFLFAEFIIGPLLQPIILSIFVWLVLLFLSLFRVGKRKNFRRWAHSGFAASLIILTLAAPSP